MSGDRSGQVTYCGPGVRSVAMCIDAIIWVILFWVATVGVGVIAGDTDIGGAGIDTELQGIGAVLALGLWLGLAIGYHTLFEWKYSKTVGKYLVGIRVVNADGSPLTLRSSAIRNSLRLIDWLPLFYVVGIGYLFVVNPPKRLGDKIGKTVVIQS